MKASFKRITIILLSAALIFNVAGILFPINTSIAQLSNPCSTWSLLWNGDNVNATGTLVSVVTPNQISDGDPGFSSTARPSSPTPPPGSSWECTQPYVGGAVNTSQDSQQAQGTESCQKAVALAGKFGGFTLLNTDFSLYIQKSALDNITNFLRGQVSSATGIDINNIQKSAFDAAGNFLQNKFGGLIQIPAENFAAGEAKKITDAAKKAANDIAKQFGLGKIATDIKNILGVSEAVPVTDENAGNKLDVINDSVNNVIAEQKRQALIQDTRDKCNNLLKTTVATIKKALLYQLSTQIVDWVQGGFKGSPQFWKQPGQVLENTGRLALDRFISRVAPQLCQPFRLAVQIQIPTVAREANPFYEQVRCTLDQVTANIENFYNDFRQGSWVTYNEVWKPQNNFYGASLMTQDAAMQAAVNAAQLAQQDAANGRGFVSQYRCTAWSKFTFAPYPADSDMIQPTDIIQDGVVYSESESAGAQDDGGPPETGLTQSQSRPDQWWSRGGSYFWECEDKEITQPGSTAASLSEKASTADFDYLVNSDDIENFLQTIQDSIVNKLVKSGVNGLRTLLPNFLPALKP